MKRARDINPETVNTALESFKNEELRRLGTQK